jgi:hypothetical protein
MANEVYAPGESIDIVNGVTAIPAGNFVFNAAGTRVMGLATRPIAANESASIVRRQGMIVNVDKVSGDAYIFGADVNITTATNVATPSAVAAGIVALGRCVEAAGSGTTKMRVAVNFS